MTLDGQVYLSTQAILRAALRAKGEESCKVRYDEEGHSNEEKGGTDVEEKR